MTGTGFGIRLVEEDTEVWRNAARSRHWIKKFDRGGGTTDVILNAGQKFELSPSERRLNQELAADSSLDFFTNGTFEPVKLTADDADNASIEATVLDEDELMSLLKGNTNTFKKKLADIASAATVQRLVDIAEDPDAEYEVSLRKVELLRDRLSEIQPPITHVRPSVENGDVATPPEDSQRFQVQRPG